MKSPEQQRRCAGALRVASLFAGRVIFPKLISLLFSTHTTHNTYAGSYLLTHVYFTVPRYTLFVLYYLSPSKFCALFSKTLQLITPVSVPPASQNLTPTLLPFPRTPPPPPISRPPPPLGTYSIDRSARPCHGLSTVDPRYLVGFRGSYVDTLGMFVEEAGAAEQQYSSGGSNSNNSDTAVGN